LSDYREIVLAHGSGGKLSQQLMHKIVLPQLGNELLEPLHDGAIFSLDGARLAFSTDSFLVSPIFFPGGDIGRLAVNGTVNEADLLIKRRFLGCLCPDCLCGTQTSERTLLQTPRDTPLGRERRREEGKISYFQKKFLACEEIQTHYVSHETNPPRCAGPPSHHRGDLTVLYLPHHPSSWPEIK
jgi:hypothetical protein